MSLAGLLPEPPPAQDLNDANQGVAEGLESAVEGQPQLRFVTQYERDDGLRRAAIALHGTLCYVCGFSFENQYGEVGLGYIHIHHRVPISVQGGPRIINPSTDLVPVCANCHAMIHRRRNHTLGVEELQEIVMNQRAKRSIAR
jgi:putative restriction endonuclease